MAALLTAFLATYWPYLLVAAVACCAAVATPGELPRGDR